MTQSAAAKAQELKISQIGDFKKRLGGIIELPSGLVVRYKNPGGIQAFLGGDSGVPNALLTTVQKTLKKGKGGAPVDSPENQSALTKDPDTMKQMLELMDRATAKAIVEPQVHLTPTLAELEADPIGPNARLGTYTNFVNLLDLAALAVPGPKRPDGLPAGITLIGPRGSDASLAALGMAFAARCDATTLEIQAA